ncbi:hypothetical protein ACJMK2_019060 [Sinanodonta woodiana]|uniref:Uncharacterized protein n=1 Tax=Sinanodonta woodiana TaxID=1069815 RepID=A0ABD3UGW3_SINWO
MCHLEGDDEEPHGMNQNILYNNGNQYTCMRIMQHQVHRIMVLVAEHKSDVPQFLDLLNAIVKDEELGLPLKQNQSFVMTYFMQFRADVAYVIDQDEKAREAILTSSNHPDLNYLISIVDLLAACAEGENRFVESICQTIFKIPELLKILNNPNISDNLKRPFLRFFLWVYLHTASGMIESGAGDLPHDNAMWGYLSSLSGTLQTVTEYARNNKDTVKQLLKSSPGKRSEMEAFQDQYGQGITSYDVRSDARKEYEDSYSTEEEINRILNIFTKNMQAAYGGVNDVQTQIGFPSREPYSEIDGNEELPLGAEFQEHLRCFIDPVVKDSKEKYKMAEKLVLQIKLSKTSTQLNENQRLEQIELNIKCFQLLRGLLHNEIVKLPPDFENDIKASSE